MDLNRLTGRWNSQYFYHENDSSQHVLEITVEAGWLLANSLPQADGSVVRLELEVADDRTLTGRWHETTSPGGSYGGREFHGAIQLLLDESLGRASGLWVGHDSRFAEVRTGRWILKRT